MIMKIYKKCWPEFFELVKAKKKNVELRLADFDIKKGDILVLEEYDPKTKKYSGRKLERKCKNINKVEMLKMHSIEDIKKYGHYLIELES